MKTTIYLIRHAEAAGNSKRFFQGQSDGGISERGYAQLECLSARFADIHIDALYSSPLRRAQLTAEAVNKNFGYDIVFDDRLKELGGGEWEGVPWADIPTRFPETAPLWIHRPDLFTPEGGEAMTALYARMADAVTDIAEKHAGQTVAVVTHGCALRCLSCLLHGVSFDRLSQMEWYDNTSVTTLEYEEGVFALIGENDVSHLPEGLSTFAGQSWWKHKDTDNFNE